MTTTLTLWCASVAHQVIALHTVGKLCSAARMLALRNSGLAMSREQPH
eukprot:CAMPEP_0168412014 /NCGR_PEP_ID=MMETSP0228-20121227/28494_1 /TAXON_ID=133427 /ORGANISM="Protoceratium reticulatum, Strain CCCM 535 (=CCMP 1889)" /LENGTH=47 /DNA_ID= /DNA_START= /DNA_END= /DNA_ORIENTATION=